MCGHADDVRRWKLMGLIGVPASSLTGGDKEGVISVSKGKVLAIQNTMKAKGCK